MSLISLNFDLSRSFFPNFGQGPFPKIAGKSPDLLRQVLLYCYLVNLLACLHANGCDKVMFSVEIATTTKHNWALTQQNLSSEFPEKVTFKPACLATGTETS